MSSYVVTPALPSSSTDYGGKPRLSQQQQPCRLGGCLLKNTLIKLHIVAAGQSSQGSYLRNSKAADCFGLPMSWLRMFNNGGTSWIDEFYYQGICGPEQELPATNYLSSFQRKSW